MQILRWPYVMSRIKLRVVFKGNPQCFSQLPFSSAFLIAFFEKKHCGFIRHFMFDLTVVSCQSKPVRFQSTFEH